MHWSYVFLVLSHRYADSPYVQVMVQTDIEILIQSYHNNLPKCF